MSKKQNKKTLFLCNLARIVLVSILTSILFIPVSMFAEIGIDYEKLGTNINMDLPFVDENGKKTTFKAISNGRPIVLALVYYKCTSICSPFLNGVAKMVDSSPLYFLPGNSYALVTLSFNHKDDYNLAARKKSSYIANLKKPENVNPEEWHFLTGSQENLKTLTDQVGFYYEKDGDDFKHASTLIVLSPTGKISRYIRGLNILPLDLMMAVTDAREDKWAPTIKKFVKMCFVKDPEGKGYYFDFLKITGILMLITIFGGIGLLTWLVRKKNTT